YYGGACHLALLWHSVFLTRFLTRRLPFDPHSTTRAPHVLVGEPEDEGHGVRDGEEQPVRVLFAHRDHGIHALRGLRQRLLPTPAHSRLVVHLAAGVDDLGDEPRGVAGVE